MSAGTPGRRLLIATGVTTELEKTAGRLVDSVERMTRLFEGKLGYQRVTDLGLNPSAKQMRDELRAFARACAPDDIVTLYHTGHADQVAGRHRLWMGDTVDPVADALPTAEIAELLLVGTSVNSLLLIIDTCFAAEGSVEALGSAIKSAEGFDGKTMLTITAAHPREQIRAGDFAGLFERAVNHPATAGYEPRYLTVSAIVEYIRGDPQRERWQTVSQSTVLQTAGPQFFPNPRYDPAFHDLDVATQVQMEQAEQRRLDFETFFARAREHFVGRLVALRQLSAWCGSTADPRSIVITGDPGSGKSALIAQLGMLSDRDWSRTLSRQGLPADTIPPAGAIDVTIHARNRTSQDILQALCAQAKVSAATAGEFLQARSGRPMVAAIDAIDEAVDADRLVASVINPLVDAGSRTGFRMLLGTRAHILDRLSAAVDIMDLDDPEYADPESLRICAQARLAVAGSPYETAPPETVTAVAKAVADAAGRSFLVATITARSLAQQQSIPDPDDETWRRSLPGTAAEAMEQDLRKRLGANAARARDLLRPLAYARGKGLPWEDIWARLASLLAGTRYGNTDLVWLRRNAGSYFVESVEAGRSVYRLYHAALGEYLRRGQADKHVHEKFVSFLLDQVPREPDGRRAWSQAHPYITLHLATHAAQAEELGRIVFDPVYLASAEPLGLYTAFASAHDSQLRQVGVAYERAMHRLRSSDLADKISYLEFAALRARATQLAERIAACPVPRSWSVRWLQLPPDFPHRVLAGHRGPVTEVVGVGGQAPAVRAASVGDDGTVRVWDLNLGEPLDVREISESGLAAIDLVDLAGEEHIAVMLGTDGLLMTREFPSLSPRFALRADAGWRTLWYPLHLTAHELRCVRLPDGRWAAITAGPGMMTSVWDLRSGSRLVKLPPGLRPGLLEFRKLASGRPVIVSVEDGLGTQGLFDFTTGRRIPQIRLSNFNSAELAYYCRMDGTPVIGLLIAEGLVNRRLTAVFDLTCSSPAGRPVKVPYDPGEPVELQDGSRVFVRYDSWGSGWWPEVEPSSGQQLVRLVDTVPGLAVDHAEAGVAARHAAVTAAFPFSVLLDGGTITLAPAPGGVSDREPVALTGHGARVTDVATVPQPGGQTRLVSSSVDGTVRIWDVEAGSKRTPSSGATQSPAVIGATLAAGDRYLGVSMTPAGDAEARIIDLRTGEPVTWLESSPGWVFAVACGRLPDVGDIAVGFSSGYAQIWRLPDGDSLSEFRTYLLAYPTPVDRPALQAAYVPIPGRPMVITTGYGFKAVIWDLVGRRIHGVLGKHSGLTSAVTVHTMRDGSILAAVGARDNTVGLWNVVSARRVGQLRMVSHARFLRDRSSCYPVTICMAGTDRRRLIVLVLCEDGNLRIFQRRKSRPGFRRARLDADGATSLVVMTLTDGRTVALTGGNDGRVSVWSLESLAALRRGSGEVRALLHIETEMPITGLCAAGDDTVVMSGLSGLAAFRLALRPDVSGAPASLEARPV